MQPIVQNVRAGWAIPVSWLKTTSTTTTWRAFGEKWLNDIKDNQKEDGNIPFVSPIHWRGSTDPYQLWPCWQSTYPLLTWYVYQYYGDKQILEDHYDGIRKLVDLLGSMAQGNIISVGLGTTWSRRKTASATFHRVARLQA